MFAFHTECQSKQLYDIILTQVTYIDQREILATLARS